jgi:hypothetical protein
MNNTLVVYDNEGFIQRQEQGSSLREPIGVPFMWVEVPNGKYLTSIDVSTEMHTPVFADLPKSEVDLLKDDNTEIKLALAELAEIVTGGIV